MSGDNLSSLQVSSQQGAVGITQPEQETQTVFQSEETATNVGPQAAKMSTLGGNAGTFSVKPRTASVRPAPPKLAKNQLPPPPSLKPTQPVAGQTQQKMMDGRPTLPPPPTNKPNLLSVEEIVKSLKKGTTENSAKYQIEKLITIAKNFNIYGCPVDNIVNHLIDQKDKYSSIDTIKILKEIKFFLLSGSVLEKLGTYLNQLDWNPIEEDLFREFGKTICSEYVKVCTFANLKKGMEYGTPKLEQKIESDLEQRITAMENMMGKRGNIIKSKFLKDFFTGIREIDNKTKQELEKHYKKQLPPPPKLQSIITLAPH